MAIQAQLYSENLGFPLCGSQDWMVDNNGCGGGGGVGGFNQFCFNVQQKHQQQQHQQQQQQLRNQQQQINQNLCFDNSSVLVPSLPNNMSSNNIMASSYSQSIAAQVAKQRQEIDQYIRLQNERLRLVLQEQRKQQLAMLLKKIESKTFVLLKQKDEEITQATKRRMELEDFLRKLEAENQAWQRVAQENEAMVMSLNNALEQVRERASCCVLNNGAEDVESCCYNREEEEAEADSDDVNIDVDEEMRIKMMRVCKGCHSRSSCMLFLPCRHLCSCKACEALLDSCPVCKTPKKASIEALIF